MAKKYITQRERKLMKIAFEAGSSNATFRNFLKFHKYYSGKMIFDRGIKYVKL
jgi:hypothetical protein